MIALSEGFGIVELRDISVITISNSSMIILKYRMKAQFLYQHLCQPFVEAYDIAAQP